MNLKRIRKKPLSDIPHCGDFGGFREGKEIRCTRDPGHEDNHRSETPHAIYEWSNKKKNPQREVAR